MSEERQPPPGRPGTWRGAANRYRRRIEEDALTTRARLQAADRLADVLEDEEATLTPEVRAALDDYRKATEAARAPGG